MCVSLVMALWALVDLIRGRSSGRPFVIGVGVFEAFMALFVIGGVVQAFTTTHDFAKVEFCGYLLGCLVIAPLAAWWNRGDSSRAACAIYSVIFLLMPVLILRVQQVWSGSYGA